MANFVQNISETVGLSESASKDQSLLKAESFSLTDRLLRQAKATISDVLIGRADITQAMFDAMLLENSAVGYDNFKNFIGGDYEYQKTIFKAVLTAQSASSPRLTSLNQQADVPDIYDRGSATTSAAAAVTVTCARSFYLLSEVVATCKGGTVAAVPRVSNLRVVGTTGYFDVELINAANERVAGQVSWASKGY